jgi:two-component system cell cycle sensor histidine kinase/response regulator CckA
MTLHDVGAFVAEAILEDPTAAESALCMETEAVIVAAGDLSGLGPRIVSTNDAFLEMIGLRLDQVLGRPVATLLGRGLGSEVIAALQHRLASTSSVTGRSTLERADGTTMAVEFQCSPVRTARESNSPLVITLRSAVERQHIRCQLEELQTSFSAVRAVARVGSWVAEPGPERLLRCSREMLEIFGLTPEELERDPNAFMQRFPPEDRERVGHAMRSVFLENSTVDIQHRIILPTGEVRWAYARIAPSRSATDGPYRVIGVVFDITDRVRAEAALKESEQRFQAAAAASLDGLVLLRARTDGEGHINDFEFTELNRRAEELLGRTRAELLGHQLCELWPAVRSLGNFDRMVRVVQTGEPWQETLPNTFHELNLTRMRVQVVRLGDGVASTLRDVSHEEAMAEELVRAQRMESVGQLAAAVAHDFNNMLSAIMGFATLAHDSLPTSARERADVGAVLDAAKRAATLTQRLLAFSRRQVLEPRAVDLNALVTGLAPLLTQLIGAAIRLHINLSPSAASVWADSTQMEQAIVNLVVNARDAMPNGGLLRLETMSREVGPGTPDAPSYVAPGSYVRLTVSDTGVGMAPSIRARLFEPFFTTKGPTRGTGLGLASVHGFVKQSRGHITVDSRVGGGTTFTLDFPRATEQQRRRSTPSMVVCHGSSKGTETVLVVDNDAMVRDALTRILAANGYTVLTAEGPEEACEHADGHEGPIDLLLTDLSLRGTHGSELADHINQRRRGIAVLYMSGCMDERMGRQQTLDQGAVFVPKPVSPQRLLQKVREALALHAAVKRASELNACEQDALTDGASDPPASHVHVSRRERGPYGGGG